MDLMTGLEPEQLDQYAKSKAESPFWGIDDPEDVCFDYTYMQEPTSSLNKITFGRVESKFLQKH